MLFTAPIERIFEETEQTNYAVVDRSGLTSLHHNGSNPSRTHRVLISDPLAEIGLKILRAAPDLQVDIRTDLTHEALIQVIPAYHALIVRSSTQVTAEVIQKGVQLRVIVRAGVGVDNIDLAAAAEAGIPVVNTPMGNIVAAAEHTIALLMAAARCIPQADAHIRQGLWQRNNFSGVQVRGKVLGLIGFGRVAREVAQYAFGLHMTVMAFDPYIPEEVAQQHGVRLTDLTTLLAQSDFVSLHVILTAETRGMLNASQLQTMKKGAFLINVARGGVVDESALANAVAEGHLAGAALDVFANEPLPRHSPLRNNPRVILTPHLGASTEEAQHQVAIDAATQVVDVLHGKPPQFVVNARQKAA